MPDDNGVVVDTQIVELDETLLDDQKNGDGKKSDAVPEGGGEDGKGPAAADDAGNAGDDGKEKNLLDGGEGGSKGEEKTVTIPGENATPEEIDAFFKAIGRPDKIEDYTFDTPEDLPKEVCWSEEQLNGFREVAHKIGLTQEQFAAAVEYQKEALSKQFAAALQEYNAAADKTEANLKKELGEEKYDEFIAAANRGMNHYPGVKEAIASGGLLSNESIIRMFAKIGQGLGESTFVDSNGKKQSYASKYEELTAPGSPYWDGNHAEHSEYVKQVEICLRNMNSAN